MVRGLFKFAIFILVAHALFRFVPPYWSHTRFESEMEERVQTWRGASDDEVQEQVLAIAQRHDVPISREHIAVRHEGNHLFVDVLYRRRIELVPSWRQEWIFESNADAWMLPSAARVP